MGVQFAGNILVQSNGGPLPIANGGTGQTTAPTAINALLPVQTGQSGKVLTTNGTNVSWSATAGGSPGGADTQIQFNDSGTFGGSANFVINKTTGALSALSTLSSIGLLISDAAETTRALKFQTAGSNRWLAQANNTAETGASAGSDFEFVRVADNGATQNQVYTIERATGVVDFKVAPTVNGSAIGGGGSGTVTSVSGTGTVSGLSLSGTVTTSGNLTLGGTLAVTASNFSSQTANTFLAAPNGSAGAPTFRTIVAADVPTLNQNTTGSAASAATATNLAGGGIGYIPYQSASGATAFLNAGTSGYVLTSNGAGIAPIWAASTGGVSLVSGAGTVSGLTLTGTVTSSGSLTLGGTLSLTSGNITTGLGYTPVNKAGDTMTGLLVLSADPTAALGAATKQYVDNMAAGVNVHAACETSTTAALAACTYSNGTAGVGATLTANANGALGTIGGYANLVVDSRLLVKDQAAGLQNGIYVVTSLGSAGTPWVLTRATDFDGSPTFEISAGDLTYIQEGTLGGTQWVETAIGTGSPGDYIIIGTNAIAFGQFSGAGTYTAGTGLSLTGTSFANTGVLSFTSGTGLSTNTSATGAVSVTNTGVTSNVASTGISVSGATGDVTITNTGVTSIVAGTNVTISGATGAVTINAATSAAPAGTLTGTTLASNVVTSSLTSVGTLSSLTVTGAITSNGLTVGYLEMPQRLTGSTTLVMSDSGKHIYNTTASQTYTIPAATSVSYPIGTALTFVNTNSGTCTISINSDTMYFAGSAGVTGSRTLGAYGMATALKVAGFTAAGVWIISGTGLT